MSKGNGSDTMESFYQDEKNAPGYKGHENRANLAMRMVIDKLDDLETAVKEIKSCKDDCVIPKRVHQDIPLAIEAVEEVGGGEFKNGVITGRDQTKEVGKLLSTRSKLFERALFLLVGVGVMYAAKKMGWM